MAYGDGGSSMSRLLWGFQDEIAQDRGVMLVSERIGKT